MTRHEQQITVGTGVHQREQFRYRGADHQINHETEDTHFDEGLEGLEQQSAGKQTLEPRHRVETLGIGFERKKRKHRARLQQVRQHRSDHDYGNEGPKQAGEKTDALLEPGQRRPGFERE